MWKGIRLLDYYAFVKKEKFNEIYMKGMENTSLSDFYI